MSESRILIRLLRMYFPRKWYATVHTYQRSCCPIFRIFSHLDAGGSRQQRNQTTRRCDSRIPATVCIGWLAFIETRDFRYSSAMFRNVDWQLYTEVSVISSRVLDCLNLHDGTDRLSRNVNHQSTVRNIPEERRAHLDRGGSLKSRNSKLICEY